MKKEFYDRLKAVIAECEAHPYKTTMPIEMENGWKGRISKENLGAWSYEDYDELWNHKDKTVDEICEASRLDCWVICEKGGHMYLVFN